MQMLYYMKTSVVLGRPSGRVSRTMIKKVAASASIFVDTSLFFINMSQPFLRLIESIM